LRVFENRLLRRIFGLRRDEIIGRWSKLHNEELNDLYCSPNIVRVIKSRGMRWAGHIAQMRERSSVYRVLVGNLREKDNLENPCIDRGMIFRKWDVGVWTGSSWLRIGTVGGYL